MLNILDTLLSRAFSARTRAASNLATNVYTVIVGIVFVPIYINYLGVEAYGIIGAFTGLTAFVWLFDLGIATNINREMAGFHDSNNRQQILDLKKTLEVSVYIISAAIFVALLGFVYLIAHYWFNTERFTPAFMLSVMAILAFSLALQFPTSFYLNGLMGLRQQVAINIVGITYNTTRCVGAVVAILIFEDKIRSFLIFQASAAVINLLLLRLLFEYSTGIEGYKPKVDFLLLKRIRQFASELFANNLVTILLTQADKVVLSRMLSLEQFGYYMLAFNIVTMSINTFSSSVNNVLFPNLVRHVNSGDTKELERTFHLGTRVMAWGAVSIGTVLIFLSEPVLQLWTQNAEVVRNTAPLLALLAAAFVVNVIMLVPYYLQHAFGRSHITFLFNLLFLFIYIPSLIFSASEYGAVGAASVWFALQLIYFVVFVPVIRSAFLRFDPWRYFFSDIGRVVAVGIVIGLAFSYLDDAVENQIAKYLILFACSGLTIVSLFLTAGLYSRQLWSLFRAKNNSTSEIAL